MPRLTRPVAALAALALSILLLACGADEEAPPERAGGGGGTAAGFPVTLEHKFGTTEVPERPERVVTVGYTDQDVTLALGVVPVGVADFLGGYDWRKRPWAQKALGGAQPAVVSGQEIDFEAVAAQRPDLIIAINAGLKTPDYEKLSRIAPTVAQPGRYIDFGTPWDEQTLIAGRALGLEDRAREVVAGVKAKFARVREAHPELEGSTAILAYGGPDGYGAYASQDTRSRVLAGLGMKTPARVDELAKQGFFVEFSQEQFRLMDQEVVVMYGAREDVLANPVFRRLDAVREDRVIYLDLTDQFAGALGFASALSLPYLLDQVEGTLAAAADGDRATRVAQPR